MKSPPANTGQSRMPTSVEAPYNLGALGAEALTTSTTARVGHIFVPANWTPHRTSGLGDSDLTAS
jgi:hypothetical protein